MLKINDIVKISPSATAAPKFGGTVLYIACFLATTAGGKVCDKKTCGHKPTHVWVRWPDGTLFVYTLGDLVVDDTYPSKINTLVSDKDGTSKAEVDKIKTKIKEKDFNFDLYTGYHKIKTDRNGNRFLVKMGVSEVEEAITPPIELSELDWIEYTMGSGKPLKKI